MKAVDRFEVLINPAVVVRWPEGGGFQPAEVRINGQPLIELVRAAELLRRSPMSVEGSEPDVGRRQLRDGADERPRPQDRTHRRQAYRVMPIFQSLRRYLDRAFEMAAPGEVSVVGGPQGDAYRLTANKPKGWESINLRTELLKIIRRAGLQPWPKLYHNMRASCETDLMNDFPIQSVTRWLGNTPSVVLRHYLQPQDEHFERAAGQKRSDEG